MSNPDDPAAWVHKAEGDLLNIRNNLASGTVPWDTVCYHAQQAAEKMLKALLVGCGQNIVRTHDLLYLLSQCVAVRPILIALQPDCLLLQPYSTLYRYPSAADEPTPADGRSALAAAERVYAAVLPLLAGNAPEAGTNII